MHVIVHHTHQGLISLVRTPTSALSLDLDDPDTARHILAIVHPYHSALGKKHKTVLTRKIRKIIRKLLVENQDLEHHAKKIRGRHPSTPAVRSFVTVCQRLADIYTDQRRIDNDCKQ